MLLTMFNSGTQNPLQLSAWSLCCHMVNAIE